MLTQILYLLQKTVATGEQQRILWKASAVKTSLAENVVCTFIFFWNGVAETTRLLSETILHSISLENFTSGLIGNGLLAKVNVGRNK